MKKVATMLKSLWKDESGQGATEYVLLVVVVVALVILFRGKITEALSGRLDEISNAMGGFNVNQ